MSSLGVPRIHFLGRFYADPSTINNDPVHYTEECDRPSPWQSPNGTHNFWFEDTAVTTAVGLDGISPASSDPVLGAAITTPVAKREVGSDKPIDGSPAKLVDLDVYQQGVSTIYGMEITITLPSSGGGSPETIFGRLDPPTLNGFWFSAVLPKRGWNEDYGWGSYGGDGNAAGRFLSVLRVKKEDWKATSSDLLNSLREACEEINGEYLLSFCFVLDGYDNIPTSQTYLYGRVVATLGAFRAGDSATSPAARWLTARALPENAAWYVPALNDAPFALDEDRSRLIIDLGNSICRTEQGGPPVNLSSATSGTLTAYVTCNTVPAGSSRKEGERVSVGQLNVSASTYNNHALIQELPLTSELLDLLKENPLSLETDRTDIGPTTLFAESDSGEFIWAEDRCVRMEGAPGTKQELKIGYRVWGKPVAGRTFDLAIWPVHGDTPGATVPPTNPGDTAQADGVFAGPSSSISPTDSSGYATISLEVRHDPGMRTTELDGQLYFVFPYGPSDATPSPPPQQRMISLLVFSDTKAIASPTFADIQSIFGPYMKLYPSMKDMVDLTDEQTFMTFSLNPPWELMYGEADAVDGISFGAIPYYMTRETTDSRFMPVTRDLSPNRAQTVLNYVKKLQREHGEPVGSQTGGDSTTQQDGE